MKLIKTVNVLKNYSADLYIGINGSILHKITDKKGRSKQFILEREATIKELEFLAGSKNMNNDLRYVMFPKFSIGGST